MKMNFKMFSYSVVFGRFTTLAKDSRHTGNLFGENIGGLPSAILKYIWAMRSRSYAILYSIIVNCFIPNVSAGVRLWPITDTIEGATITYACSDGHWLQTSQTSQWTQVGSYEVRIHDAALNCSSMLNHDFILSVFIIIYVSCVQYPCTITQGTSSSYFQMVLKTINSGISMYALLF